MSRAKKRTKDKVDVWKKKYEELRDQVAASAEDKEQEDTEEPAKPKSGKSRKDVDVNALRASYQAEIDELKAAVRERDDRARQEAGNKAKDQQISQLSKLFKHPGVIRPYLESFFRVRFEDDSNKPEVFVVDPETGEESHKTVKDLTREFKRDKTLDDLLIAKAPTGSHDVALPAKVKSTVPPSTDSSRSVYQRDDAGKLTPESSAAMDAITRQKLTAKGWDQSKLDELMHPQP